MFKKLQLFEKIFDECNQSTLKLHVAFKIHKKIEKDLMCCI
jgi:hypothetical protein